MGAADAAEGWVSAVAVGAWVVGAGAWAAAATLGCMTAGDAGQARALL